MTSEYEVLITKDDVVPVMSVHDVRVEVDEVVDVALNEDEAIIIPLLLNEERCW
jgi:hypothetical protein